MASFVSISSFLPRLRKQLILNGGIRKQRRELTWVWRISRSLTGSGGLQVRVECSRKTAHPVQRHWGLMYAFCEHCIGSLCWEGTWGEWLDITVHSLNPKEVVRPFSWEKSGHSSPKGAGIFEENYHFLGLALCKALPTAFHLTLTMLWETYYYPHCINDPAKGPEVT